MHNFFNKFKSFFSKEEECGSVVQMSLEDGISIEKFYEYYLKNIVVYRCINMIAKGVSNIKVINEPKNWKSFIYEAIIYYLITGNIFIDGNMQLLDPKYIKIIDNQYEYKDIKYKNLLHIKFFNPLNNIFGLSPLYTAQQAINIYNTLDEFIYSMTKNGGKSSGIFIIPDGVNIPTEQKRTIQNLISALYDSKNNKAMISYIDMKWIPFGTHPKDINLEWLYDKSVGEIAGVFGLSKNSIGYGDPTYSNLSVSLEDRYNEVFCSYLLHLIEHINHYFSYHISLAS